ncbi:hypothetical protein BU15DRAFT_90852 [Melanogaster broomeanus]|nr:hypothetical protein BU15DRAFT_90852 [Melanogaster broomeanus]
MPSRTLSECPPYDVAPPPTQFDLEFADLAIIDLSKAHTPEGRAELASQLRCLLTGGDQRDRVFDIADVPFMAVPPEEVKICTVNVEKVGCYAGKVDMDNGILVQIEHWQYSVNVNRIVTQRLYPQALCLFLFELDAFARHNHFNVLHPILSLELPEETLVEKHNFDGLGPTTGMATPETAIYRRTEEEEEKSNHVWIKGHTDIGSVTILWSQPVSGLQIPSADGKWRWVRHIDDALVSPTIHHDRLGNFDFTMADDHVKLSPLPHSRVLQSVGIERCCPDDETPLSEMWRKERMADVEEEVMEDIAMKHYD